MTPLGADGLPPQIHDSGPAAAADSQSPPTARASRFNALVWMMVMLLMMAATYISVLPRYGQGWIHHITTRISLTTAAAMPALAVSSPS